MQLTACAELPRDVRDALVSWNHSTEYKLPEFQSIGAGAGIGGFEKVYDTSELPQAQSISPSILLWRHLIGNSSICMVHGTPGAEQSALCGWLSSALALRQGFTHGSESTCGPHRHHCTPSTMLQSTASPKAAAPIARHNDGDQHQKHALSQQNSGRPRPASLTLLA